MVGAISTSDGVLPRESTVFQIYKDEKVIVGNVFAIENLECLLQGFDLFLAAGNAILIADARVHAGRLELVEVGLSLAPDT